MKKLFSVSIDQSEENPSKFCWKSDSITETSLYPPSVQEPEGPHDWRDGARAYAQYHGFGLQEIDLQSVSSFFEVLQQNGRLHSLEILHNVKVENSGLPADIVLVGADGDPLLAWWEDDGISVVCNVCGKMAQKVCFGKCASELGFPSEDLKPKCFEEYEESKTV